MRIFRHRYLFEMSSFRGLTGDVSHDLVKLARALANVLYRNTFVVAMHTFILFGGRVNWGPAVSDDAELSIKLAFSITAQHLGCDNRAGVILLRLASD